MCWAIYSQISLSNCFAVDVARNLSILWTAWKLLFHDRARSATDIAGEAEAIVKKCVDVNFLIMYTL